MLYTDNNEPVLKALIDGELSSEQKSRLEDQPSYIKDELEGTSRKFIEMLATLVNEYNFDATIPLKNGVSLLEYA